jgi:hypothetical protein
VPLIGAKASGIVRSTVTVARPNAWIVLTGVHGFNLIAWRWTV